MLVKRYIRYMNLMSFTVFAQCLLLLSVNAVFAEPYLQLDAHPSSYVDGDEQSIVTSELQFTLYALVNSEHPAAPQLVDLTTETFYISVAIVPDPGQTDPDLGSYEFGGGIFNVTDDGFNDGVYYDTMTYGVPPLDAYLNANDELPSHGVYDTYYREHSFTLDTSNPDLRADLYDAQVDFGGPDPDFLNPDGELYFQAFYVDASDLLYPPYRLHFDLYTKNADGAINKFAPFSHDVLATPIPASVVLGILGLGVVGLKLRKFA